MKVAKVNTISVRGRFRRQGAHAGYTASSKKAIVTLTKAVSYTHLDVYKRQALARGFLCCARAQRTISSLRAFRA